MLASAMTVIDLFDEFHRADIRYCHWKSNEHLAEAMAGDTDFDILVDPAQRRQVEEALLRSQYKRFTAVNGMSYPAVEDYLGFNPETGKLAHIHLHYRLTVGEKHLKGYRLPWEELLLRTRVWNEVSQVYTAHPEAELLLLLTRAILKIRLRDRLAQLAGKRYFRGGMEKEYQWLCERVNPESCGMLCAELFGASARPAGETLLRQTPDLRSLLAFRRAIAPRLRLYRTYPPATARWLRLVREIAWLKAGVNKRYRHAGVPLQRTVPSGGILVAFLGADGSGKSTLLRNIRSFFSWKLDVFSVYFGSGDGPSSPLRYPLCVVRKLLRRRGSAGQTGGKNAGAADNRRKPSLLGRLARVLWALALSWEKRQKLLAAWSARNRGMIVITDRYPQAEVMGFTDGPLLDRYRTHRFAFLRWLAGWEALPYQWANLNPPDLVIRLNVDPETAVARKPEMTVQEVQRRVQAVQSLHFPAATRIVEVDANRPLDEVLLTVKSSIWSRL